MNSPNQRPAINRVRQILTVLAILGSFVVNTESNIRPLNGQSVGEISNIQFSGVLLTPANYAFVIWGLIYVGLIGFGAYQFLSPQRQHSRLNPISYMLVFVCIVQSAWIYLFLSRLFALSVLAMLGILLGLIGIYRLLGDDRRQTWQDKWLLKIPFSVYLGWISVATVVNVALALYDAGWNGWGVSPEIWTVLMMVVSSGLGVALLYRRQDIAFTGVLIWALVAIAVRQANNPVILIPAIGLAVLLAVLAFVSRRWVPLQNRRHDANAKSSK